MDISDKETLELCKAWFEGIMERCDRLTSGNVSHNGRAIHGYAKNCAEFVAGHLKDRWKPSEAQVVVVDDIIRNGHLSNANERILCGLLEQLKKLREE